MDAAASPSTPVRVLIADDHHLFTQALEAILATDERVEVVGRAHDGEVVVELARSLRPDVVLMDIGMPGVDGIEATKRIRRDRQDARVLILTGSSSSADVDRAKRAGAAGYVTKDHVTAELVEAILDAAGRPLS